MCFKCPVASIPATNKVSHAPSSGQPPFAELVGGQFGYSMFCEQPLCEAPQKGCASNVENPNMLTDHLRNRRRPYCTCYMCMVNVHFWLSLVYGDSATAIVHVHVACGTQWVVGSCIAHGKLTEVRHSRPLRRSIPLRRDCWILRSSTSAMSLPRTMSCRFSATKPKRCSNFMLHRIRRKIAANVNMSGKHLDFDLDRAPQRLAHHQLVARVLCNRTM
jgi:hypothetical protein